jgi:hypothetical protein
MHRLPLQIGSHRIEAGIAFSAHLGVGFHLLGRLDIFEYFRVSSTSANV